MRDLVGYGRNRPDPQWPGGARLAVNITLAVEEGAEDSVEDGFDRSEAPLTDVDGMGADVPGRDLTAESMMAYGSRVGFWRLQRLLEERGLPATIAACAVALEYNPQIAVHALFAGYDLLGHGYRYTKHYLLDEEEERAHLKLALASFKSIWGAEPDGWYCRYGPSEVTRALLVEHGFLYDSDAYDDELPYWSPVGGRKHLVIPNTGAANDDKFSKGWWATGDDLFTTLKDTFDVLYAEGERSPGMMTVILHPRVSGHAGRSAGVARFLDYARGHDAVWWARRSDIARHWYENFPPEIAR
ncbi:allantoinase [Herbiconiux sp. KACC 21604]|uniref:allantoinase n=1 Tax=unclassified Herbiconiux TaxID=2618217 RepID=UPI0015978DFA|nr:allantoinase [Herbiconiux sp. SALV-R1]QJU54887.1 chitin deacetylase [Herbiconiux sp. SALV-R1]WPO86010.1 allantoinase [Herbiconiux sp. KACC 21604]